MVEASETGDEEVVVGANEHRLDQGLIHDVNGRLAGQGKKGSLKLASDRHHLAGGFVLRRGKIKTRCENASVGSAGQQSPRGSWRLRPAPAGFG